MHWKALFASKKQGPVGPDDVSQRQVEPSGGLSFGSDPEKTIVRLFAFFTVLVAILLVLSAFGIAELPAQIVIAVLGELGLGVYYVLTKRRRR